MSRSRSRGARVHAAVRHRRVRRAVEGASVHVPRAFDAHRRHHRRVAGGELVVEHHPLLVVDITITSRRPARARDMICGPAAFATTPVKTKMPEPTLAPIPMSVTSKTPRLRWSRVSFPTAMSGSLSD